MAEHGQAWDKHTLDVTPQDPWAPPPVSPGPAYGFQRGVASVHPPAPRTEAFGFAPEPTGTGWPGESAPAPRRPLAWHVQRWRHGGEWSGAGLLFAFVCWGIWAILTEGGLVNPLLIFLVTLGVAAGLFALSRLLGRVVLERQLGRVRRTARGAHLVTAIFLVGVGFAHLRQTEQVMTAWHWVTGLF